MISKNGLNTLHFTEIKSQEENNKKKQRKEITKLLIIVNNHRKQTIQIYETTHIFYMSEFVARAYQVPFTFALTILHFLAYYFI